MNKPLFKIQRLGSQNKSQNYDEILTKTVLDDVCKKLYNEDDYDVQWIEKRNEGRLFTCEYNGVQSFINMSQYGPIQSRNNYFQSVSTALGIYLKYKDSNKKLFSEINFYFYFLPFSGNNLTSYMKFFYKVMKTVGIKFLNYSYGLGNIIINEFTSVKDMINERNNLRGKNTGNQSTYITDEGKYYHIYGKTFGANQKETTLLCLGISTITDKPVKLFQIIDNCSSAISEQDVLAIRMYNLNNGLKGIEILDDTYQFDSDESDVVRDNLRSPKFVYNLLQKTNGKKRCILCDCKIESIVQAAHIYPVAEIRKRTDIPVEKKIELAVDKDNGIWLCENHHKLFDRNLIWFECGKICISNDVELEDQVFIKRITTIEEIEPQFINERMMAFFDMREGTEPRLNV